MWPFRRKPEEPTPGALLARSMLHPDTEGDWREGHKYPNPIWNDRLGVTLAYCSIFHTVRADTFQLSAAEQKELILAIREMRRRRAERQKLNEFERIVAAFEGALSSNEKDRGANA